MKTILQMILAKYKPLIEYVGQKNRERCYHVTLPEGATEDDIYGAKEAITHQGYTCLCYHTNHNRLPHLGVFAPV